MLVRFHLGASYVRLVRALQFNKKTVELCPVRCCLSKLAVLARGNVLETSVP